MTAHEAQVFHVSDEQAGATLASAMRGWLAGESWSAVKRLVHNRHVMLNGNMCIDPERRLTSGEVVKLMPHPLAPPPTDKDVRVVYFDKHVLVVDKPAGVTTTRHHEEKNWSARRKQQQPTLDEMLPGIMTKIERGKQKKRGHHVDTVGRKPVTAVHRIDRETSGLLVFARTVPAARHLIAQFREHTTQRKYLALAIGDVPQRRIESHLVRDRGDGRRGSAMTSDVGKRAVTHVTPIESIGDEYTLVECRLETGRTHQIRIHLAEIGHPLCGERVYNRPLRGKPIIDRSGAQRIALHAAELGFVHPHSEQQMQFEAPLPADLKQLLKRLKRSPGRTKS